MNTKICALLLSCLFMNATILPMMPDEEAVYIKQERDNLSCKQIGKLMILIGANCAAMATLIMAGPASDDLTTKDITSIAATQTFFVALHTLNLLDHLKKQNHAAARKEKLTHRKAD